MKKLILLLSLILCVTIGAKTLTDLEKKEMLKQFSEFQQAVRNKDENTLKKMIKFPVSQEILSLAGYKDGKIIFYEDNLTELSENAPVTEKVFLKYKENAFRSLSKLNNLKVDLNKNEIIGFFKDGATAEDKKKKYDMDVEGVYFLDKNNKKVRTEYICDLNVTGEFEDDELHVTYGVRTNELMKDIDGGACHIFTEWYTFVNDKGKLKLSEIMSME